MTTCKEKTVGDVIQEDIALLRAKGFVTSDLGDLGDECDTPIYALAEFVSAFVDSRKSYKRGPRLLWRFPIGDGQQIEIKPILEKVVVDDIDYSSYSFWSAPKYGVRIPVRVGFDKEAKAGFGGEFRGFIHAVDHYVALRLQSWFSQTNCELLANDVRAELESLPVIEWVKGLLKKLASNDCNFNPGGDLQFSHCMFCGRPLIVPESIYCGFGPECGKRLGWHGKVQVSDTLF